MISIIVILLLAGTCTYFIYRAYTIAGVLADAEEYVIELEDMNQYMYDQIKNSYDEMKKIDYKGSFESDDEAGTTFTILKEVIDNLEKELNGTKEKEVE
mgnify:CR=1 FL=1